MINIGRKQLKKLYKGDEVIATVHKGEDLIYYDLDALYAFKFTVDTTLDTNGGHTTSSPQFKIGWRNNNYPSVKVDWGDGNVETITSAAIYSGVHTYSAHGTYQISITPSAYTGLEPTDKGWLSGIFPEGSSSYTTSYKIVSIDTKFPKGSYIVGVKNGRTYATHVYFTNFYNIQSAPEGIFDNIEFASQVSNVFANTFESCGKYGGWNFVPEAKKMFANYPFAIGSGAFSQCFYDCSFTEIPEKLFANLTFSSDASNLFKETFRKCVNLTAIPSDVFSDCDFGDVTNASNMFNGLFYDCSNITSIGSELFSSCDFSSVTNATYMFYNTFYNCRGVTSIPEGFFNLSFGSLTSISSMFRQTFSNCKGFSTIPQNLFVLDTSGVTDFSYMFHSLFYEDKFTSIPADLFSHIDTSSGTNFSYMFAYTFSYSTGVTGHIVVPNNLFSIDTSNGLDFSYMFNSLFNWCPIEVIPDDIFDIDTSNGVTFTGMFSNAFYCAGRNASPALAKPGLIFSHIDTSNGVTFNEMFSRLFYGSGASGNSQFPEELFNINTSNGTSFKQMFSGTFATLSLSDVPENIFSYIDTSNGEDFTSMFSSTFEMCGIRGNTPFTIPSALFTQIDTSKGKNFTSMFANTFYQTSYSTTSTRMIIPSDLFDLDFTHAENFTNMFSNTFACSMVDHAEEGLFANIPLTSSTINTGVFNTTFGNKNSGNTYYSMTITDVFQGMTDFSWINANNAHLVVPYMYGYSLGNRQPVGAANTILQHFNFTPTSDTDMFAKQTSLTDYATINDNWK